ncbi:MAG: hypothetical protein LBI33_03900 [Propionibacteriaceae bacterium]|nr:hypothetical protein [Propionibacteriaceae bacterium]
MALVGAVYFVLARYGVRVVRRVVSSSVPPYQTRTLMRLSDACLEDVVGEKDRLGVGLSGTRWFGRAH